MQIKEWLQTLRQEIKIDAYKQMNTEFGKKAKEFKKFEEKWMMKKIIVRDKMTGNRINIRKMRILI